MDKVIKGVAEMDIVHTGYLRRIDTRETPHVYTLRDYGCLECPDTELKLSLTDTTIIENKPDLTVVIIDKNHYSIMLCADDTTAFLEWTTAFAHVSESAAYRVTREVIAKGDISTVFRGFRNRDGVKVAVKAVSKRKRPTAALVESHVSRFLSRAARESYPPGLVRCLATYHTRNETHSVMEAVGTCLDKWLRRHGPLTETSAKRVVEQLISALSFLHERDLVHCGVTAENTLLSASDHTSLNVQLGGFSKAYIRGDAGWEPERAYSEIMRGMGGVYAAPELLEGTVGPAADFWSLGVLLYRALVGRLPFYLSGDNASTAEDRMRLYARETRSDLRRSVLFPVGDEATLRLSPDARSFLSSLLIPSPEARMSARSINRHPWLRLASIPRKRRSGSDSPVDVFSRGTSR